jgi:hypothetical protein
MGSPRDPRWTGFDVGRQSGKDKIEKELYWFDVTHPNSPNAPTPALVRQMLPNAGGLDVATAEQIWLEMEENIIAA